MTMAKPSNFVGTHACAICAKRVRVYSWLPDCVLCAERARRIAAAEATSAEPPDRATADHSTLPPAHGDRS